MAALEPGTVLQRGSFVIVSQLGEGGFGAVYLAHQPRLDRDVAIKVLHPEHGAREESVERFRREALAAAGLSHPNVLPVFDFDFDPDVGLWFLAMQYIAGARSLDQFPTPMDPPTVYAIISGVASALDAAHARGIIHRDVKPANVLMDGSRPLLTDFGIAHLRGAETITGTGLALGTPIYMSPEQAMGRTVGPQSDQYSLAVMAFHLLAGEPPYTGDAHAVLYQHVHEPTPSPQQINPDLSRPVAEALLRAMRKAPEERFPACSAFAADLAGVRATPAARETIPLAADAGRTEVTPRPRRAQPAAAQAPEPSGASPEGSTARPSWPSAPLVALAAAAAGVVVVASIAMAVLRGSAGSPAPAATRPPARATSVALTDDFGDPSAGFLPSAAPESATFRVGYVDHEYEIAGPRGGFVAVPGIFRDAIIAVDARLVGAPATGRVIGIVCRANEQGWYELTVTPSTRSFSISKMDISGTSTSLVADQVSPAIQRDTAMNHLEMVCVGSSIAASANGTLLGDVHDDAYKEGWFQISVVGAAESGSDVALRLGKLSVAHVTDQ